MPSDQQKDVLFQCAIDPELHARYVKQRERWGMTNREMFARILADALPQLEEADGPPFPPKS